MKQFNAASVVVCALLLLLSMVEGSGGVRGQRGLSNCELCHLLATCTVLDGGYACQCPQGYHGDGYQECDPQGQVEAASGTQARSGPLAAVVPATPAPVVPVTPAPVVPVTPAPVVPVTPAPVVPVTPAPVVPVTPAPVAPVTPAPVAPVTPAPVPYAANHVVGSDPDLF